MSEERRLDVLRAIVEDYVRTREPVGSRVLTERHNLGVSPATIRNDMAALEDAGLIAQPHTSAGRIPTDKGYRLFVDHLATVKPLSQPERHAIEQFLDGAVDLDDVVARAGRLLAELTGQVAVVQYPSLRRSGLRHLELVAVGEARLLVVIITDTGRVEQRMLDVATLPDEGTLAVLRARLNAVAVGRRLPGLATELESVAQQLPPGDQDLARRVGDVVVQTLAEEGEERVVLTGTANLARTGMRFEHALRPVLEALEEQVVLLGLLTEMAEDAADRSGVRVRIGHETQYDGLSETSVVTTGYGSEGRSSPRSARSARPAWTTPRPSRRCAPSPAT
ncbi:heat-inducible transcription repressor HrcA [Luteimicrobium album]|uniref:Heat-inducible transcription repressor HrcA n=1 Tax=Luteimicrobium album TaxID=1054550 RepID=A0ABQ6I494_9MICO|nr:heat-inducible transcription repressor HrcA [Luteimicrobium album]